MDHSPVLPNLHVGSCPKTSSDIDQLKRDIGITAVVNLQTEADFAWWDIDWPVLEGHYRETDMEVRRLPVVDLNPHSLRSNLPQCVEALEALLKNGHTVYLHCNVGVNRSPSVTIAYLHWIEGRTLNDAVDHVKHCRSCSPYVDAIRLATEDRMKR
jgi:atypical dual specificity phosphatase